MDGVSCVVDGYEGSQESQEDEIMLAHQGEINESF
jgi:hypothetical protein